MIILYDILMMIIKILEFGEFYDVLDDIVEKLWSFFFVIYDS